MRDRLVRFLTRELLAARSELAEVHALPVDERVDKGDCIDGLRFLEREAQGRLLFECPDNPSRFRVGERLSLGYGEDPAHGVSVVFVAYDPFARRLRLERDSWNLAGWEDLDLTRTLSLERAGADFGKYVLDAVLTVYAGRDERASRIVGIVERTVRQTEDAHDRAKGGAAALGFELDTHQKEAFIGCFSIRPFHLVQGPPGSGKTHLIACLAAAWARAGERLLVTAYTHRAVNNVLRAVLAVDPALAVVKAGEKHNAEDLPQRVERVRSAKQVAVPVRGNGQVVGATVFALKNLWSEAPFDRVVFDEAAQIPVPHAICGMLAGRRYVFVGDHRQLGPIVVGEHEDEIARLSIFGHLVGEGRGQEDSSERGCRTGGSPAGPVEAGRAAASSRGTEPRTGYSVSLLRHTYRMNPGINDFPSRHFYGGALLPAGPSAGRRFALKRGGPFDDLLDPERPAVMAMVAHEGCRTRCLPEARLVVDLLLDLLVRQGMKAGEIAVIAPFRAQTSAIRDHLHARLGAGAAGAGDLPVIDTVERMQGQEREAVIVSLTCSEPEYAAREAAFFFSPTRLNVTLTRARTKLVIVASPHLFGALPPDLQHLKNASLFARLDRDLPKVDMTDRYIPRG